MRKHVGSLTRVRARFTVLTAALAAFSASCHSSTEPGAGPELRLRNTGTMLLSEVQVVFPGSSTGYGDVAGGSATPYQRIPAIYHYAAYQFKHDGKAIMQPVIDWVGESPMEGKRFTYEVELDVSNVNYPRILLKKVERDQ